MITNTYKKLKQKYNNKKVLVVGLGLQGGGSGVARFFAELGAVVTVTDKKTEKHLLQSINRLKDYPITFHLGKHSIEDFLTSDIVFKGPSVPWSLNEIKAAQEKKIPVEMELSFVAQNTPAKIIGVTGTRGKTTTVQMIYEVLKKNDFPVYLGGSLPNISTINYLKDLTHQDWLLMELPSWPLSGFHQKKISPHVSIFTNLYPDHLNYYKNMKDYLYDKKAIYRYQSPTDFLIANKSLEKIVSKDKPKSQITYYQASNFPTTLDHLRGSHNLENAAAAFALVKILELNTNKSIKTIKQFNSVPYRQQNVGQIGKITFINDTTSTTPVATIKALDVFTDKNIVLLIGNYSKNLPFNDLIEKLSVPKKIVLLKGSFTDQILPFLIKKYPEKITEVYDDFEKAIKKAYQLALELNDECYVLLSPAAASFSLFNNEFHRGDEFNRVVQKIIK